MPSAEAVQQAVDQLDRRINEHNRVTYADRAPPDAAEGAAVYLGSASCQSCHSDAYSWWRGHAHGRAYATLQDAHKEFHFECVGCHVTGYEQPGGSTVTQNLDGALVDVGCENCHGPGSLHVAAPAEHSLQADTPESVCVRCHNEEHSDLFDYDVYVRTLRVPGHGLPAAETE